MLANFFAVVLCSAYSTRLIKKLNELGKGSLASRAPHERCTVDHPPHEVQARFPLGLTPYEIRERTQSVADQAHPCTPACHECREEQESDQTADPSLDARRFWRSSTVHPRPVSHRGSLVHTPASSQGGCFRQRPRRVVVISVSPKDVGAGAG
jgi:hypothetical protein